MNDGFNKATPLSDEWCTPEWLFKALDSEFGFTLDGAATKENTKCSLYCTKNTLHDWSNQRVFCNPPYSNINWFVTQALRQTQQIAVLLLPVRTDSDWFRLLVENKAELRFFRKRIKFLQNGVEMSSPRFASVVAIIKSPDNGQKP
jgi:phage N-6-adenine-methyltransferase